LSGVKAAERFMPLKIFSGMLKTACTATRIQKTITISVPPASNCYPTGLLRKEKESENKERMNLESPGSNLYNASSVTGVLLKTGVNKIEFCVY
jgi:hypothetical protein